MAELQKLEKVSKVFERLFNLADEDGLTNERFKAVVEKIIKMMQDNHKEYVKKVESLMLLISETSGEIKTGNSADREAITKKLQQLDSQYNKDVNSIMTLMNKSIKRIQETMPEEYDDIALWESLNTLEQRLNELPPIPEAFNPSEILTAIEDLKNKVEELSKRPTGSGGVTNARIIQAFKYILKTEAPIGAINGSNTVYTVSQPIFAVLAFSLNGEVIAQLPNYTIAGNTITFSSALPAAYSGKDFEIKFI